MSSVPTPFVYPSSIHKRTERPAYSKDYKKYKSVLQKEFGNKCVYCRTPDGLPGYASFGVEHYKPKKKFPALSTDYNNLYYCCNTCNSRKSDYWPSSQQKLRGSFVVNPCDYVMSDYLRYSGDRVHNKNRTGEFMVELLDLNIEGRVERRRVILTLIKSTIEDYKQVRGTVRSLDKLLRAEVNSGKIAALQSAKDRHERNLKRIREALFHLTADKRYKK